MKKLLILSALALPFMAPSALADTVRTSDGISCSFDADDNPWEIEAYTESASQDKDQSSYNSDQDEFKIGTKVTYRFGGPKRLNCDKLYQLELRSKEARVKQLEEQVKALEAVNGAEW